MIRISYVEKIVKPWPQILGLKTKTKGPWADTKISWANRPVHSWCPFWPI